MIIFRGESNLTMEDIALPEGFVIFSQEKAWMDESLMFIWFEKVWQTYAKEKQNELDFGRSFIVYAFKTYKTDNVKVLLATDNTNLALLLPAGCTSKCPLLDVYIKNPLSVFYVTMSLMLLLISPKQSSNVRVLIFHRHRDRTLLTGLLTT